MAPHRSTKTQGTKSEPTNQLGWSGDDRRESHGAVRWPDEKRTRTRRGRSKTTERAKPWRPMALLRICLAQTRREERAIACFAKSTPHTPPDFVEHGITECGPRKWQIGSRRRHRRKLHRNGVGVEGFAANLELEGSRSAAA